MIFDEIEEDAKKSQYQNINVRSARICILKESAVFQIKFSDLKFRVPVTTPIILDDPRHIIISDFSYFTGEITSEALGEPEQFLIDILSQAEEADNLNNYHIVFDLNDIISMSLNDCQLLYNTSNSEARSQFLNSTKSVPVSKWDLIGQLPPTCSIKLNFDYRLLCTDLTWLLEFTCTDYSSLQITEFSSFYFLTESSVDALSTLIQSNKYLSKIQVKVPSKPVFTTLLFKLAEHQVLYVCIEY